MRTTNEPELARTKSVRLFSLLLAAMCAATFVLSAQRRPVLKEMVWSGLDGLAVDAVVPSSTGTDTSVTREAESLIAEILRVLGDRGYLNASARVVSVEETPTDSSTDVRVSVNVQPGRRSLVGGVLFEGLRLTGVSTARTVAGLKEGQEWSSTLGERGRRRLVMSRVFTEVAEPTLRLNENGDVLVQYVVRESRPNRFDGMVGYLPPVAGGSKGSLTGLVALQFGNLFGTARKLDLRWFQENRGRQEISVRYREPALAGYLVSGTGELHQRRQDSSYVFLRSSLAFDAEVGLNVFAGVTAAYSSTTPSEGYGRSFMSQSTSWLGGIRFLYDARDRPDLPRSGVMYATDVQTGRKTSTTGTVAQTHTLNRLSFDAAGAYPVDGRQSIYAEIHGRDVRTGEPDEADATRIGGATTLRGYREAEFAGTRVVWSSAEYRFFLSSSAFAGVFVDAGFIQRPDLGPLLPPRQSLTRIGFGITSRFDSPVGDIGLSIALGEGDAIGDAKLHLRLITAF